MVSGISSSLNGLDSAVSRLSSSADKIARSNVSGVTQTKTQTNNSDIKLDEELVNSKLSAINYTANAKVLKAQLDREKEIIDILA